MHSSILYKGINIVNKAVDVSIDKVLSVCYDTQVIGILV